MKAGDVLRMQLNGSFNLLLGLADAMTDAEWRARKPPDLSPPGFVIWHGARIIDWGIHCAIQGVPELAVKAEWAELRAAQMAYGAGLSATEASEIAASVSHGTVRAYLAALQPIALQWLDAQGDAELERIPDFEAHQRVNARYLSPPVWAEVESLAGVPAWQILARPCISHIRVHVGEVETLLQMLRAEIPA